MAWTGAKLFGDSHLKTIKQGEICSPRFANWEVIGGAAGGVKNPLNSFLFSQHVGESRGDRLFVQNETQLLKIRNNWRGHSDHFCNICKHFQWVLRSDYDRFEKQLRFIPSLANTPEHDFLSNNHGRSRRSDRTLCVTDKKPRRSRRTPCGYVRPVRTSPQIGGSRV